MRMAFSWMSIAKRDPEWSERASLAKTKVSFPFPQVASMTISPMETSCFQ